MWVRRAKEMAQKIKDKIFSSKNPCSDFFGSNASDALDDLIGKLTAGGDYRTGQASYTGIQQTYSNPNQFVSDSNGVKLYRSPQSAVIFTNGPFTMQGTIGFGTYGPGTAGTQIIALLHEIAHNIVVPLGNGTHKYLIPNDGNDADQSSKNTEEILKNCKDQVWEAQK